MEAVVVFTTYNDVEAEMIRNLLDENGIPCQVVSDIAHSVFPFTHDHKLSEVRVAVNEQEAHRAEQIIDDFLSASEHAFSAKDADLVESPDDITDDDDLDDGCLEVDNVEDDINDDDDSADDDDYDLEIASEQSRSEPV